MHAFDTYILPSGYQLAYSQYGQPQGHPIFYCHGFPNCRIEAALLAEAANQQNIRLIAVDRPGMGHSDYQPARTLSSWSEDLQSLADYLGLRKFAVLGLSGGGPYALACAAHMDARLRAVAIVSPLGPLNVPGLLDRMLLSARLVLGLYRLQPSWSQYLVWQISWGMQHFPGYSLRSLRQQLCPADKKVLNEKNAKDTLRQAIGDTLRQGSLGPFHELKLYSRDWGFNLQDIQTPVKLWHGETDRLVPIEMSQYLASQLPHCKAHYLPDEGHFSLAIRHAEQIFQNLKQQCDWI